MEITNEFIEKHGFKRINNSMWRNENCTLQNGHTHKGNNIYESILNTKKAFRACANGKFIMMIENENDFAIAWYGSNISKIENTDEGTITDQKAIVDFCLDRLSENQGSQLQLAIQGMGDWLDKGLIVKN